MRIAAWVLLISTLGLASCASTARRTAEPAQKYCVAGHGCYRVLNTAAGYSARGIASWYGRNDAGRPTASGVRFNPDAMRIAHRTLPFGTWVVIRDLDNGREAVAMVDDRGPFYRGRILDATPALARRLGFLRSGTAHVDVRAIPSSALNSAERRAAITDERSAVSYARRHPHAILAEAGHVAVRGVIDITATGFRIGVGVARGALDLGLDVLKAL